MDKKHKVIIKNSETKEILFERNFNMKNTKIINESFFAFDITKIEIPLAWNERKQRNNKILTKENLQNAINNKYTQELLNTGSLGIQLKYNNLSEAAIVNPLNRIGYIKEIYLESHSALICLTKDINIKNKVLGFAYLGYMKGKLFIPKLINYTVLLDKDKSRYIYD